jgi:hypothetical protein
VLFPNIDEGHGGSGFFLFPLNLSLSSGPIRGERLR